MSRTRSIRTGAVAACITAALAVPAGAGAMPVRGDPPVSVHHDSSTAPSVIREVRTITEKTDQTLPITLSALAIAIALGGGAFVAVRQRPTALRR